LILASPVLIATLPATLIVIRFEPNPRGRALPGIAGDGILGGRAAVIVLEIPGAVNVTVL